MSDFTKSEIEVLKWFAATLLEDDEFAHMRPQARRILSCLKAAPNQKANYGALCIAATSKWAEPVTERDIPSIMYKIKRQYPEYKDRLVLHWGWGYELKD